MTDVSVAKPAVRPARPFFSSGPCAKRPGWTPEALKDALVGRSHRSKPGKAKLKDAIARTKALLGLPEPAYAHHPLVLDENGKKFSKRDNAVTLAALREAGATPSDIRARLEL